MNQAAEATELWPAQSASLIIRCSIQNSSRNYNVSTVRLYRQCLKFGLFSLGTKSYPCKRRRIFCLSLRVRRILVKFSYYLLFTYRSLCNPWRITIITRWLFILWSLWVDCGELVDCGCVWWRSATSCFVVPTLQLQQSFKHVRLT